MSTNAVIFKLFLFLHLILYPNSKEPLKFAILVESINRDSCLCLLYLCLYCLKIMVYACEKIPNDFHLLYFFLIKSVLVSNISPNLDHDKPLIVTLIMCFK